MIDNKKLMKELASIYASSNKAKNSIISELSKIDERYRKLAEQEKAKLNDMLKNIEAQLGFYGPILDLNNSGNGDVADVILASGPEEKKEEEEPVIQDTIFPENNEPEDENVEDREVDIDTDMPGEWVKVPEPVEKKQETKDLDAEEDEEWEQKIQSGEITEEKPEFEKKEVPVLTSDESGWGEFPADWQ